MGKGQGKPTGYGRFDMRS